MAQLEITDSDGTRSTIEFERGRRLTIGRREGNDIALKDRSVSKHHANLVPDGDDWLVEDLGSRNGTFLNGERVTAPTRLRDRARIALGHSTLEFSADRSGESDHEVTLDDRPFPATDTVMVSLDEAKAPSALGIDSDSEPSAARSRKALLRRYEIIESAGLELLGHEPVDVLLPKILDLVFRAVAPDRAALMLNEPDGRLVCRAFRGDGHPGPMSISRSIARTVREKEMAMLAFDAEQDPRFPGTDSIKGVHSVMAVPLRDSREVIGLLYVDSLRGAGRFDEEDLRLATLLANIAAIQIENASLLREWVEQQRLQQEARSAAEIHRRLLPATLPSIPDYSIEGFNIPCSEVGGDYYDCLSLAPDRYGLILADVAGHGMGAAMLLAVMHATWHSSVEIGSEPDERAHHLNRAVCRCAPSNRYITATFIDLDHAAHRLRYVNAGHAPEPLLVRATGEIERLPTGGLPLGILPVGKWPVRELRLGRGDFVFLCSDGVTETADPDEELFGEARLQRLLVSLAGQAPAEVRRAVEATLQAHARGAPQADDLSMLILSRRT